MHRFRCSHLKLRITPSNPTSRKWAPISKHNCDRPFNVSVIPSTSAKLRIFSTSSAASFKSSRFEQSRSAPCGIIYALSWFLLVFMLPFLFRNLYTTKSRRSYSRLHRPSHRTFSPCQLVPLSDLVWLQVVSIQRMGKKRGVVLYSTAKLRSFFIFQARPCDQIRHLGPPEDETLSMTCRYLRIFAFFRSNQYHIIPRMRISMDRADHLSIRKAAGVYQALPMHRYRGCARLQVLIDHCVMICRVYSIYFHLLLTCPVPSPHRQA